MDILKQNYPKWSFQCKAFNICNNILISLFKTDHH